MHPPTPFRENAANERGEAETELFIILLFACLFSFDLAWFCVIKASTLHPPPFVY